MLTRRTLGKYAGMSLVAMASGVFGGCTSGVFNQILAWIPVGISAVTGIVTVLGSLVPPQALAIITLVKAAFADLQATVTQYNADTNPADKATLLAKIRTILADIVTNFQSFLDALNLPGGSQIESIVLGLASVVLSAIEGFMTQLPTPTKAVAASFKLGAKTVPITPKVYKSTAEFKAAYNAIAVSGSHPEIAIH